MHGARQAASGLLGAAALAALLLLAACGEEGPASVPPAPPDHADEPASPQVPPPETTPASHASLRVFVEWPDRRVGERRAEVTARFADGSRRSGTTDSLGEVSFVGVPPGDADLWARAAHPLYGLDGCRVEPEGESEGYVYLDEGVAISGRVLDAGSGAPVEGAVVGVPWCMQDWSRGLPGPGGGISDAAGRYGMWWVPRGPRDCFVTRSLAALAPDHALALLRFPDVPRGRHDVALDIVLEAGGSVRGRVTCPDGGPGAGARVALLPQRDAETTDDSWSALRSWRDRRDLHAAVADAEGRYEMLGVPFGTAFTAVAEADGYARSAEVRDVTATASAPEALADLVLGVAARLRLCVVDPETHRAASARVYIEDAAEDLCETGEDGVLELDGLEPGRHLVRIAADAWPPLALEVETPAGVTTEVVVRLDPGVAIQGVLVDTAGTALSGTVVVATALVGGHGNSAPTDADGRFRIVGLSAGRYRLQAKDAAYGPIDGEETVVDAPTADARLVVFPPGWLRVRLQGFEPGELPATIRVGLGEDADAVTREPASSRTRDGEVIYLCRVPAGRRTYRFEIEGYAPVERTLDVPAGEAALDVVVPVGGGPDLVGRVLDAEGRPVPEVWVDAVGVWPRRTVTDARGRFRIPRLAPGRTRLRFTAEGHATAEQVHDHEPGGAPLVVVLPRGGLLRGRVVDASGQGLATQDIVARPVQEPDAPTRFDAARTTALGTFSMRLAAGRYDVGLFRYDRFLPLTEVTIEEGGDAQVELRAVGR